MNAAAFAEPQFDVLAWVNSTLVSCEEEEPLDSHIVGMLMRMQLLSQDLQYDLQDKSELAILSLPKCLREMQLIRNESVALQERTENIRGRLAASIDGSNKTKLDTLTHLDGLKCKAEACVDKLREAESLDNLRLQVEAAFGGSDVTAISAALAAMQASLVVVGQLPEGQAYRAKLGEWLDRLQSLVTPPLLEAIEAYDVEAAVRYRDVLTIVGQESCVVDVYRQSKNALIEKLWRAAWLVGKLPDGEAAEFAQSLCEFFDEVAKMCEKELSWGSQVFEDAEVVLLQCVQKGLRGLQPSMADRLQAVLSQAATTDIELYFEVICALHTACIAFAQRVHMLVHAGDAHAADAARLEVEEKALMAAVFEPFLVLQQEYLVHEQKQLLGLTKKSVAPLRTLNGAGTGTLMSDILKQAVGHIDAAVEAVLEAASAAVMRCIACCCGVEMKALLEVLGFVLQQLVDQIATEIHKMGDWLDSAARKAAPAAKEAAEHGEDNDTVQSSFELLLRIGKLRTSIEGYITGPLRKAVLGLAGTEDEGDSDSGEGSGKLLAAAVYHAADAERADAFKLLLEQGADPSHRLLRAPDAALNSCLRTTQVLVFRSMFNGMRGALRGLSAQPHWAKSGPGGGIAAPGLVKTLPSFSVSPLEYVHKIAEHLIHVPTLVREDTLSAAQADSLWEVLASQAQLGVGGERAARLILLEEDEDEEQDEDYDQSAYLWLSLLAKGTAATYLQQIERTPMISDYGAVQLTKDLDYLCNVLSSVELIAGPALQQAITLLGTAKDSYDEAVKTGAAEETFDSPLAAAIRRARFKQPDL